jgi:hypothetical protein
VEGGRQQHANGAGRGRQVQGAFGEQAEQVEVAGGRPAADADSLVVKQARGDALLPIEAIAVRVECRRDDRVGQHAPLNHYAFVLRRRIQNGRVEAGDEVPGAVLHHVPGRVAQHGVEPAAAVGKEHLGEGKIPGQGERTGVFQRALANGRLRGPASGVGNTARQRQVFVIGVAGAQHRGTGPGSRQAQQRRPCGIQAALGRLLQHEIGDIPPDRGFQGAHLRQRGLAHRRQPVRDTVRQQRIERPAAHRQRRQRAEKWTGQGVGVQQPVIEKGQRQPLGVRFQPQRQLGEFHRQTVAVHAVKTMHGHQPTADRKGAKFRKSAAGRRVARRQVCRQ